VNVVAQFPTMQRHGTSMSPDAANRNDLSMVDGTAASPRLCALDRRAAGDAVEHFLDMAIGT
jgi:hypothetical protein